MIGDSITDSGRNYAPGFEERERLGDGYVNLVNACFTSLAPEAKITVINQGINGNTMQNLKERWQEDVLDMRPDYVSVMIGINDAWHQYEEGADDVKHTYEKDYEELIVRTKPKVKAIYILGSFILEKKRSDPMRMLAEKYAAMAKRMAIRQGLVYVDIQSAMDRFMDILPAEVLSKDRIHPNTSGHMIIAMAFLKAIGFSWYDRSIGL